MKLFETFGQIQLKTGGMKLKEHLTFFFFVFLLRIILH